MPLITLSFETLTHGAANPEALNSRVRSRIPTKDKDTASWKRCSDLTSISGIM